MKDESLTPVIRDWIGEGLGFLAAYLAQCGITELKISKDAMKIEWDIPEVGHQVRLGSLEHFFGDVENRYHEVKAAKESANG